MKMQGGLRASMEENGRYKVDQDDLSSKDGEREGGADEGSEEELELESSDFDDFYDGDHSSDSTYDESSSSSPTSVEVQSISDDPSIPPVPPPPRILDESQHLLPSKPEAPAPSNTNGNFSSSLPDSTTEGMEHKTLNEAGRTELSKDETAPVDTYPRVFCHSLKIPLSTPLEFLLDFFTYPDYFLYLTIDAP